MAARGAVSFLYGHDPWVADHAPLDGLTAMHIWATQIRLSELKKKKKRQVRHGGIPFKASTLEAECFTLCFKLCKSEGSLVYLLSSRPARTT